MQSNKTTQKYFLFWSVVFSLIYNLFWLLFFLLFLFYFEAQVLLAVMLFLLVYLLFAQPLKEFFFLKFYKRSIFKSYQQISGIEKKIPNINTSKDIELFLIELVKSWQIKGLRFFYYFPKPTILYINERGRTRTLSSRKPESASFVHFIRHNPFITNRQYFPKDVQLELEEKNIECVAPIVLRENLFGFLAFEEKVGDYGGKAISLICQRIALVFENDYFSEKVSAYQTLQQEIDTAKRIESLLQLESGKLIYGYSIEYQMSLWKQKHFPALLDLRIPKQSRKQKHGFMILARLNSQSARSKSLQLFIAQGYFYSLAQTSANLNMLVTSLHELLRDRENSKILLDGFIAEVLPSSNIRVQSFGSNLSMAVNEDLFPIEDKPCLGSQGNLVILPQEIPFAAEIELYIQKYSLVQFVRKTS